LEVSDATAALLVAMSPATIDRRLAPDPAAMSLRGRGTFQRRQGTPPVALPARPPLDVLDWITTAHQHAAAAEHTLAAAITRAPQAGQPWSTIGALLGVSRQAAQQRLAAPQAPHAARIRS